MLLRLFCRRDNFHQPEEFDQGMTPIQDELIVYTWWDATLAELSALICEVFAEYTECEFTFRHLFREASTGRIQQRHLGSHSKTHPGMATLGEIGFLPGDYIDVCIKAAERADAL